MIQMCVLTAGKHTKRDIIVHKGVPFIVIQRMWNTHGAVLNY